jgi:hypothetical protein
LSREAPDRLQLLAIAVLAGAVLAFEIVLLRLFEFSHWHHFAGLAIALALIGFGAAGTLLSLLGGRAAKLGDGWLTLAMIVTAGSLLVVLLLHARISLRPLFAVWDAGELLRLLAVDFAAFLPFFGAGLALGQVFARWPGHPGALYAANLIGSGVGTIAATASLAWLMPERSLAVIAALLLAFAAVFAVLRRRTGATVAALALGAAAAGLSITPPPPHVSDFKALARATELPDAEVLSSRPGLAGRLSVIRSDSLRFAPGLSLDWTGAVPASDLAVIGSDHGVPLQRSYAHANALSEASLGGLALSLRPSGPVLAVGTGTWATPAHAAGRALTWLVSDRRIPALAAERGLDVDIVRDGEVRFMTRTAPRFAVIALDRAYGGRDAASEDYLLTADGLTDALSRLRVDGLLAIPLAVEYPPRQAPRLFQTLARALDAHGVDDPGRNVAALRGLQSMLVLASPSPLAARDLDRIGAFAQRWRFDAAWLPGMTRAAANRYHRLDEPAFFAAARAAFGDGDMPAVARWFVDEPATEARPYFWRAMRWTALPALFAQQGNRAASYLDWTLVMSAVALVATTLVAALLVVAPLGRMSAGDSTLRRIDVVGYFGMLGLAFMLVELALLQRMFLFVDVPVLASAVVFAVFMIGAGAGSATVGAAVAARAPGRLFATLSAGAAIGVGVLWWPGAPLLALPEPARIAAAAAAMAPLAWAMGRLFPWGLARLATTTSWLPWAWAINGFASVLAASAATLSSVHLGQPVTLAFGACCYAGAWAIARSLHRSAVRSASRRVL